MLRSWYRTTAMALALTALAGGCTDALKDNAGKKDEDPSESAAAIDAWPTTKVAGTATSPLLPEVEIQVHDVIRSGDGLSTVVLDVVNDSNDDLTTYDLVGHQTLMDVTLLDPGSRTRYYPLQRADDQGTCVCSGDVDLLAGATTTLYATFTDLPEDLDTVRIGVPHFTPIDGVGIEAAPAFATADTAVMGLEAAPELSVRVRHVARADDGTVVRLEYRNEGADPVSSYDFPDPTTTVLIDPDKLTSYEVRYAESTAVISPAPDGDIQGGKSFTRDLLMAPLPRAVDEVIVRGHGMRRSFPVAVTETDEQPRFDVPRSLDDPATFQLVEQTARYRSDPAPVAEPVEIDADEVGPELPTGDPVAELKSPAQPGWTLAPRNVVRVSDDQALLVLDLQRGDTTASWPEGVASDYRKDLSGIALIDPGARQRLGALGGDDGSLASDNDDTIEVGETRTLTVAFPAPKKGSDAVTVDVPSFGQVADVPIVDGPKMASADGDVLATMRSAADPRLRMDVLSVGRLPDGTGTLVRTRMVNESHPDAVTTPFGLPGYDDLCRLSLVDPDRNDRFFALDPCAATTWEKNLAAGESLVFEVRFPDLPDGVERLAVHGDGYLPSPPVAVTKKAEPWYLDLPRTSDDPAGDTLAGSVGVADDLQSEVRSGDSVEVSLRTDVLFDFGSASLSQEAQDRLTGVAERLVEDASGTVVITGHTDNIGDDPANLILSQQRADAVRSVLDKVAGGTGVTFEVEAKGESEPVVPNEIGGVDNPDGRARNRRVVITYTAG